MFRDKKEVRIQSYFTNLCLYTTPNNPSLIQYLRLDLDKALKQLKKTSSLQGLALKDKPAFSFQGHPEASPGPHDIGYLFDRFIDSMMVPTHA